MTETIIRTKGELEEWLGAHGWLADSFVRRLDPMPRAGSPPAEATIEIGQQVEGGFEAGELRVLRRFELRATEIAAWQLDPARAYDADHCADALYALDAESGVGISIDVPGRLVLLCGELRVTPLPDLDEIIQPFVDDAEFSANVPAPSPTPAEWIEMFAARGVEVVWRQYGTDAVPAENVPAANYSGWFLQNPARLADDPFGIFFFHHASRDGSFIVHLQNQSISGRRLWTTIGAIIGSMSGVEIRSGNCRVTGAQWMQYLREGYIGG